MIYPKINKTTPFCDRKAQQIVLYYERSMKSAERWMVLSEEGSASGLCGGTKRVLSVST